MTPDRWRRHAHRGSVWSRLATVPAFVGLVYFRAELGPWVWLAVLFIGLWLWLNVRIFPPVQSDETWEARAIFGEMLWLQGPPETLPPHHLRRLRLINAGGVAALGPLFWGLWALDPWATAFGASGLVISQLWALDRYAWLYADMTRQKHLI